jgi:periplasmic copper chaperone A
MKLNTNLRILAGLVVCIAVSAARAHSFKLGEITIGHPYARTTAAGQASGGGYLKLENKGADDKLLSATADVAASVELHSMSMEGDVMRMRQVDGVALPKGKTVELKPGALHLMFVGLKAPLKDGDKFPLKLKFEKAGEVTVTVNVEAGGGELKHDMMKH